MNIGDFESLGAKLLCCGGLRTGPFFQIHFSFLFAVWKRVIYQKVLTTKQLEDRDLEGCTIRLHR